jgi:phenylacetate-coenzyme A ligase PaaK-like adenylate-forming protein
MNIDTLFTTPSLAEFILHTLNLNHWGSIKTIITTGESVSFSFVDLMYRYGAEIIASYGTSEYFIGISNDHSPNYYFDPHKIFVEVLDEFGEFTTGEGDIYITAWESEVVPLIRYPLGDKGRVEYFLDGNEVQGQLLWSGREQKKYELSGAANFTKENISEFVTSLNQNVSECKIILDNLNQGIDQITVHLTFSEKESYSLFNPEYVKKKFSELSLDINDVIYQGFVKIETKSHYDENGRNSKRKISIQDKREYQR